VTTSPRSSATRRRARRGLALALAASLLAAACGDAEAGDDAAEATEATSASTAPATDVARTAPAPDGTATVPFEHSQGVTEVPVSPQRIVTMTDQNALLPLLELGVKPVASAGLLAGDGTQVFRRTEGFDTAGIGFVGAYGEANAEAVAAQRPDLIVGYEFDADYYDTLSAIAPTVLVQVFERGLDEALLDFARLVGQEDRAVELQAEYDARIAALLEGLGDRRDRMSVSVISAGDPGQFYREDSWQAIGTVTRDLDLLRPPSQQGEAGLDETFSLEQLSEHDADVVLVIDYSGEGQDPGLDALVGSPLYANLAAAQADQAFLIDGTQTVGAAWARMSRFLDDLERILLDPELDVDVVDEGPST
jgi:iron complex transport system substrate-binding protein